MWYLCVFYHRLLDYRKPEVESLADLFGAFEDKRRPGNRVLQWRLPQHHHPDSPFYFVDLPSEDVAKNIANRSILVKGIYELWGEGGSYEELEEAVKSYPDERKLPYLGSESTFKITVDSFGKVMSLLEQNERIRGLSYISFKGRVNLKNPDHNFWLMETDDIATNNGLPPVAQRRIFFGREVGGADRKLLPTYQLKSRNYLGPTAMDAEMAFLMANQAQAAPGKLVYDPFVGTGSILVSAAHFGAMTMGADIDIRVVRDGRGPDRNVWSNFKQYGLPMPIALLRADNNLPPWRPGLKEVFDAIICDPPYGVRAGGRKSGGRKLLKGVIGPYTVPDDKRADHIPSTAPYSLAECVHDLLDLAARMLVIGGRLVFFYPVSREEDSCEDHFPEHPCFELVATSEQILSSRYSRVLLTMVKTSSYTEELALAAWMKHLEFKANHSKWLEEGSTRLVIMMVASLWGMSIANKDWGSGYNHTNWDWGWGWGWGPYHPPNQTQGPNKINVGGSENWHFGFNYTEWAFQNGPFYFNDTLVFKYDPPSNNTFPHSVYLLPNLWSFLTCDLRRAKMIASPTQGGGDGFHFVLNRWRPYYFACGERNGFHCKVGRMRFMVVPFFRWNH